MTSSILLSSIVMYSLAAGVSMGVALLIKCMAVLLASGKRRQE